VRGRPAGGPGARSPIVTVSAAPGLLPDGNVVSVGRRATVSSWPSGQAEALLCTPTTQRASETRIIAVIEGESGTGRERVGDAAEATRQYGQQSLDLAVPFAS
jgi:hypothetical protein